jgi:pSer/pThr/pTyr-binding forkhead associated (FHA) protein
VANQVVARVIVKDADRTYLVDLEPGETLVAGRSAHCDLPITARRASRRHCEIAPAGPEGGPRGHVVRDLGSTNGTTLNGAPVTGEPVLGDRDVVDAGGCLLVYRA